MDVAKLTKRGADSYWQVLKQGQVQFDDRPDWLLLAQPIGGVPKEVQWIHPSDPHIQWVRAFNL